VSVDKLALVLWDGDIGGAERFTAGLATELMSLGSEATLVFVGDPFPLAADLPRTGPAYVGLGFQRGRQLLHHPRRYARQVSAVGPDGALLVSCGLMGATLRAGGYRAPIVAVEHGDLLQLDDLPRLRQIIKIGARALGAWADDVEVGVSEFMLERMRRFPHARRQCRIYNGIADDGAEPRAKSEAHTERHDPERTRVGFMGRLIPGKGADQLIRAVAAAAKQAPVRLLIAGDGPEKTSLECLVDSLGVHALVDFVGVVHDVPSFWRECDIAAIPSDAWVESFSMATLEAMSARKAIVATRAGAIPELVPDGVAGTLVTPGDHVALTRALVEYALRPELRDAHGAAARERAINCFAIGQSARAYRGLFEDLRNYRRSH
jgi:glycosyltransferase involved in cell wall biosynthesis